MAHTVLLGAAVDGCFEKTHQRIHIRLGRLLLAGRGHKTPTQLVDGLLPNLRFLASVAQVHGVQREAARPVLGVVAINAIALDDFGQCLGIGLGRSGRCCLRRQGDKGQRQANAPQ